jgi:hypothetical protein
MLNYNRRATRKHTAVSTEGQQNTVEKKGEKQEKKRRKIAK